MPKAEKERNETAAVGSGGSVKEERQCAVHGDR